MSRFNCCKFKSSNGINAEKDQTVKKTTLKRVPFNCDITSDKLHVCRIFPFPITELHGSDESICDKRFSIVLLNTAPETLVFLMRKQSASHVHRLKDH